MRDNTIFINEITRLSFIIENHGFATVLDRFSTSSTIALNTIWVPQELKGIYLYDNKIYLLFN